MFRRFLINFLSCLSVRSLQRWLQFKTRLNEKYSLSARVWVINLLWWVFSFKSIDAVFCINLIYCLIKRVISLIPPLVLRSPFLFSPLVTSTLHHIVIKLLWNAHIELNDICAPWHNGNCRSHPLEVCNCLIIPINVQRFRFFSSP